MRYYDKNGRVITEGVSLRMEDGCIEKVYATTDAYGEPDLGINASNEAFLRNHPEQDREYYSLSDFNSKFFEIVDDR